MKKKLQVSGIVNELHRSPFFAKPGEKSNRPSKREEQPAKSPEKAKPEPVSDTMTPRHHDTMQPRNHDTVIPRYHDTKEPQDDILETVRRAVKELGKEAATHRFTLSEKKALADLIYTYKQEGVKTSENEITRIAINYLIQDFRTNGETSVLAKLLKKLNG